MGNNDLYCHKCKDRHHPADECHVCETPSNKDSNEIEGGKLLYEALCRNLIAKILKNNPTDSHDIDLILEGYIHKAKFYDTIFENNFIIPRSDNPEKWVDQYEGINKHGLRGIQLKWRKL